MKGFIQQNNIKRSLSFQNTSDETAKLICMVVIWLIILLQDVRECL